MNACGHGLRGEQIRHAEVDPLIAPGRSNSTYPWPHSMYLGAAAMMGVPGLVAVLWLVLAAWRLRPPALERDDLPV